MRRFTSLQDLITSLGEDIERVLIEKKRIELLIANLNNPKDTIEEKLIIEYLVTRSTPKVAQYAKSIGHRTGNRNFSPGDMSELIKNGSPNISPTLLETAQFIFNVNKTSVMRQHG